VGVGAAHEAHFDGVDRGRLQVRAATAFGAGVRKVSAGASTPTYRSASIATSSATNVTATRPTGSVSGDLLVYFVYEYDDSAAGSGNGFSTPTGLTSLNEWSSGGFNIIGHTFSRVSNGTATDLPTFADFSGASTMDYTCVTVAVSGATAIDANSGTDSLASASVQTAPAVTATTASGLLLCSWASFLNTPAAGKSYGTFGAMTLAAQGQIAADSRGWHAVAYQQLVASGSTGTRSATASSSADNYVPMTVLVK
jgi:hypothetical protein